MYQQKFNGQILKTNGKQIAQDMKEKMELIFNENIDALRVSLDFTYLGKLILISGKIKKISTGVPEKGIQSFFEQWLYIV